jgi:tetratricopeptide (TPR) repeat protein
MLVVVLTLLTRCACNADVLPINSVSPAKMAMRSQARALLEESQSIRREISDERGIAFCLVWLATLESAERNYALACDLYRQGLALYRKVGDREGVASCLERLPEAYAGLGQIERAVRLWGAAEALRRAIRAPIPLAHRSHYERAVARVRAEWDEETFARAWTEGCGMTLEDAIAYVLSEAK